MPQAEGFAYIQYLRPDAVEPALEARARRILAGLAGGAPVVLTLRHPLQVAASWAALDWGRERSGPTSDFEVITGQQALLDDFPVLREALEAIDRERFLDRVVFQWAAFLLVPRAQLGAAGAHVLLYENLLLDPDRELEALFRYLGTPCDPDAIRRVLARASGTNFQQRDPGKDRARLLDGWRDTFSPEEIERANGILARLGLADLYDDRGRPTGLSPLSVG